ncbi:MAG: helix-turn-helix domain-containing protein [Inquilinaceae bacterium]
MTAPDPAQLSKLLTEREAAAALGVSVYTLHRERRYGRIRYTVIGLRKIRYTEAYLAEYIAARSVAPCLDDEPTAPDRSGTTGSPSGRTRPLGAGPGSTPALDRRAAHRLAQQTFGRPNSGSPNG